jgi:hypothetical protein
MRKPNCASVPGSAVWIDLLDDSGREALVNRLLREA